VKAFGLCGSSGTCETERIWNCLRMLEDSFALQQVRFVLFGFLNSIVLSGVVSRYVKSFAKSSLAR
jgi:hypothetical protein